MPSSHPSSPKENGTLATQTRSRPHSKSTLEENAYEDIVGKHAGSLAYISLCLLAAFSWFTCIIVCWIYVWFVGRTNREVIAGKCIF